MTEDEEFYAWLDGELDGDRAAAVAARVAARPELSALADRDRAMSARLRAAFDGVAHGSPFPPRAANENRSGPSWTALAASLLVGVIAGSMVGLAPSRQAPVEAQGGHLVAAAALDRALDTQLASARGDSPVRIGLTFRDPQGRWCRSFDGAAGAGLACRDKGDWAVRALFPATPGGDYRMAAGMDPRLAAVVDDAMTGEAADARAERAARDGGWR